MCCFFFKLNLLCVGELQPHSVETSKTQLVHHLVEDRKTCNSSVIFTKLDGYRVVPEADADLPSGVDHGDADVVDLALLLSSQHLNIEAPVQVLSPLAETEELVVPGESVEKGSVKEIEILAKIS